MTDTRTCPECHAEIPADAPPGVCPHCALRAGLRPETAAEPARVPAAPSPEELSRRLPDLDDFELIGPGGMGTVYRARHRPLDRPVAVKVLHAHLQDDASFAERFTREARTMARLDHPHIVRVYDFGHREGLYYLVMELVDGVSLRQALADGGFTPAEALAVVPRICEALQYAHDQGVVHRDIKPENILLDRSGSPKIVDFGLALLTKPAAGTRLTRQARVLGTPHYMAPEQIERPAEVDHRADIYALGVVFYEMLTGELPIGRFPPPSQKVEVDVRLDEVVLRTLEKEPRRRYQQARELSRDVEQTARGTGARRHRDRPSDQGWTPTRGGRRRSPRRRPDFEYRSTRTVWGLPLIHIAHDAGGERMALARGIVAIGDMAVGLVAIGGDERRRHQPRGPRRRPLARHRRHGVRRVRGGRPRVRRGGHRCECGVDAGPVHPNDAVGVVGRLGIGHRRGDGNRGGTDNLVAGCRRRRVSHGARRRREETRTMKKRPDEAEQPEAQANWMPFVDLA